MIADTIIVITILGPISIVELVIQKDLGTYDAIKQMYDFAVQVGTGN